MSKFMCTSVPGFEDILWKEIESKISDAKYIKTMRGKVLFATEASLDQLTQLRCADNIYFFVEKFQIGPHKKDLEQFGKNLRTLNFKKAIDFIGNLKCVKIIVSASKKGKQTYSRFDISNYATMVLIGSKRYKEGTIKDHNFPIRIDVVDSECIVSVQLTPSSYKFRGECYKYMPGGIRPTIASCLIFLSNPCATDVFYDPFCGSGTIPRERSYSDAKLIMASDYDPVAVKNSKKNVSHLVKVFCCDATKMKVTDGSVNVIVSNIPYGKQIIVEDIFQLYVAFLNEAKRVLTKNGRMVLLTSREEIVEAAKLTGFFIEKLNTISLHGLLVTVYLLKPICEKV